MIDAFVQELEQESVATGRLLEAVPEDKLGWKPHSKSMTLGELALHVGKIPGLISDYALNGTVTATELVGHPPAESKAEILEGFREGISKAKDFFANSDEAGLNLSWTLTDGDKVLLEIPKSSLCRMLMFNHWYHHRGQLTVYLRLLDVAIPSIYGPSADENPFG